MSRKKVKYKKWFKILVFIVILIIAFVIFLLFRNNKVVEKDKEINIIGMDYKEALDYYDTKNIKVSVKYEYNDSVLKDKVISYDEKNKTLVVSLGKITKEVYEENKVNELGNVPIMMYHGIVNKKSSDTEYIGGNVDKDGYNRTSEAFRSDLEFYYNNGYRMIRLNDYVDGNIAVELGKSPIILTFDDGNENNFKVLGRNSDGSLIIDPECAVGILEEFKKKYPDFGVTATFFVNSGIFNQSEYNEDILKWLVNNGYDVGNHTMTHVNFTKATSEESIKEVGGVYQILEGIIPSKYVNIVALPFGSPYKKEHPNYPYIIDGEYNGIKYYTKASLRVGWEAEVSCFSNNFDPSFLKRIRAYDNNGKDFDIEMNFKLLESSKYISDGNIDTIVIKDGDEDKVNSSDKKVITY